MAVYNDNFFCAGRGFCKDKTKERDKSVFLTHHNGIYINAKLNRDVVTSIYL